MVKLAAHNNTAYIYEPGDIFFKKIGYGVVIDAVIGVVIDVVICNLGLEMSGKVTHGNTLFVLKDQILSFFAYNISSTTYLISLTIYPFSLSS